MMNRSMPIAGGFALLVSLIAGGCAARVPETPGPRSAPAEVRALWVVRNALTHPDSVRAMVQRAEEAGFNTLIVQVRGRGDAYYNSRWEPRSMALAHQPQDYDPLPLVLAEAHRRGMSVHAWLNTFLLTNMDEPDTAATHLYNTRPDLLAVPYGVARELYDMDPRDPRYREQILAYTRNARDRAEGVYLSAASPEVKEHLYSVWMDVLERYDVDGLHFDYVRYPAPDWDYSRVSLERFRAWLTPQLPDSVRERFAAMEAADPLVWADSFPGEYDRFRREQVTEMVERIYYGAKKREPEIVISAAVFGNSKDAYEKRYQDWREWLRRGILDIAAPMAYARDTETFREQIRVAVETAGPERIWAGIGSWRIPVESTLEKIDAARALGVRGIVLFSYNSAVRVNPELNPKADYLMQVSERAFTNQE